MMLLYKDEKAKEVLIEAGKVQAQKFNWDNSANTLWHIIEQISK
jgi:hypothetical protein